MCAATLHPPPPLLPSPDNEPPQGYFVARYFCRAKEQRRLRILERTLEAALACPLARGVKRCAPVGRRASVAQGPGRPPQLGWACLPALPCSAPHSQRCDHPKSLEPPTHPPTHPPTTTTNNNPP